MRQRVVNSVLVIELQAIPPSVPVEVYAPVQVRYRAYCAAISIMQRIEQAGVVADGCHDLCFRLILAHSMGCSVFKDSATAV